MEILLFFPLMIIIIIVGLIMAVTSESEKDKSLGLKLMIGGFIALVIGIGVCGYMLSNIGPMN